MENEERPPSPAEALRTVDGTMAEVVEERPASGFDATVHAPNRLRICAALDPVEDGEFCWLRDRLGVSDSVLSKHVAVLVEAGYVEQRRAVRDTRQRVWLRLTPGGRYAYGAHVKALQEIVGGGMSE